MGTDIHMTIEIRRGLRWERADLRRPCEWCEGTGIARNRPSEKCYWCCEKGETPKIHPRGGAYDHRCYDVFAILANVRNGHGFAGIDTGDGFIPIAPQRGLPADMVPDANEYDHGEHSFSHLTLAELLAYPHWEKGVTKKRGVLQADEFAKWEKAGRGQPEGWSGAIDGISVFNVSNATMRVLIADGILEQLAEKQRMNERWKAAGHPARDLPLFCTQVEWTTTYADAAGDFYTKFIPALVKYAEDEKVTASNVRIVFGFDS